jgi:short-subunit dehydrogenase
MPSSPKIIVITGASAGIGRATALRLARDGASLAVCARRENLLRQVAAAITAAGGDAMAFVSDVTSERDMEELVRLTLNRYHRLDVMICNAGFAIAGQIETVSADQMRRLIDVNFLGTYYAARVALPVFRRQGAGHLIVVSSIVGKRGVPYLGAYSATKFAQVGLAESLRAELAGSNIHVTVVFPISTDTEFSDVMDYETGTPVQRAIGPRQSADQVANAIAKAIERPVPEVYPYRKSRGLVLLNALAPGFCDRVVKKFGRKPVIGHE